MDIDGAIEWSVILEAGEQFQQFSTRKDAPGTPHQQIEEFEFQPREADHFVGSSYLSLLRVQFQFSAAQDTLFISLLLPCSPQNSPYARKQFTGMERHGKAIVCAGSKGKQLIEFIGLIAQNENCCVILFLPQRPAEFQTIDEGQGLVEEE